MINTLDSQKDGGSSRKLAPRKTNKETEGPHTDDLQHKAFYILRVQLLYGTEVSKHN